MEQYINYLLEVFCLNKEVQVSVKLFLFPSSRDKIEFPYSNCFLTVPEYGLEFDFSQRYSFRDALIQRFPMMCLVLAGGVRQS